MKMKKAFRRRAIAATVAIASVVLLAGLSMSARIRARFYRSRNSTPQTVLWAWERPTDLRFIAPDRVAVAFLAKSISLKDDRVVVRPRLQPLNLPPSTKVIAVARIETDRQATAELSASQREQTARAIAEMATLPRVSEIQIDFDATTSERQFYRSLIAGVRAQLPAAVRLSITALASWCSGDDWISDLQIDEAVPMLFRMAGDGKQIASQLDRGEDFAAAPCRYSYGVSLDEPRPRLVSSRRVFYFNPEAWTEESVREILESPK